MSPASDGRRDRLSAVAVEVDNGDVPCAVAVETLGEGPTYPGGCTGNDHDFAYDLHCLRSPADLLKLNKKKPRQTMPAGLSVD
jgi:hypothetical protein